MTIPPAELQYQLHHIHENESPALGAFFIVCMVLSAVFVAVRLVSRKIMRIGLQADDYTILAGLVRPQIHMWDSFRLLTCILGSCRRLVRRLGHIR